MAHKEVRATHGNLPVLDCRFMHGMLHAESNSEAEHATNAAHQIWPSNERNSKEYGQFCQANLFDWLH